MCEEAGGALLNASRTEKLRGLAAQLGLDAILLITGWDGCYNLESKGLVDWLCDLAAAPNTDFKAAAAEEGVFVAMPHELAWFVEQQDGCSMADDAVSALDRLLAADAGAAPVQDNATAAAGAEPMDIAEADQGGAGAQPPQQQLQQQHIDGKLSLLLQLHPQLRRVGIALGVEVRGGVQQQVPPESIHHWPLLIALAEHLQLPMEQLFQEVVDITPRVRDLLGSVDGAHLHHTLRLRRPLLTRAWLEAMGTLGRRTAAPKLDLTEAAMAAALTEFVSGCGCRLKPGQYQPLALPPRVLLGQRTSQQEALSCATTSLRSQAARQSTAVLHATVEAADACSPLRVARTIFFGQGAGAADTPLQLLLQEAARGEPCTAAAAPAAAAAAAAAGACTAGPGSSACGAEGGGLLDACCCNSGAANNAVGQEQQLQPLHQSQSEQQQQQQQQQQRVLRLGQPLAGGDYEADMQDLFDLMCWYWAAVDAAWQCMEHYATQSGASWASARALGTQVFWQSAATAQLVPQPDQQQQEQQPQGQHQGQQPPPPQQQPQLSLQLFSWDGGPRPMPSTSHLEQHSMRFKTLRVVVSGISSRSRTHPGRPLGNVLYMDTFVDVPAMGASPPQLLNLTLTHCPTYSFNFWGAEAASNAQLVAAFRRHLQTQLQAHAQAAAAAEAQARSGLRGTAEDAGMLRLQLQQELRGGGGGAAVAAAAAGVAVAAARGTTSPVRVTKAGAARRGPLGQQQQLLLMQQLAAAGSGGSKASAQQEQPQQQYQQQQQLQQQQQQQKLAQQQARPGSRNGTTQQQLPSVRAATHKTCCGQPGLVCCDDDDGSSSRRQAQKRNCCEGPQQQAPVVEPASDPGAGLGTAAADADGCSGPCNHTTHAGAAAAAAAAPAAAANGTAGSDGGVGPPWDAAVARQLRQLGQLLLPPGDIPGETVLIFTGAQKLAVMDGPMYPHSHGLVFVSRPTKVHVLLLAQIEAVWLQDFASRLPGQPGLGPCVVIRGSRPCCGLLPAAHMTDNHHIAISLRAMSKGCSHLWVTAVLPAWGAAAAGVVKPPKGAATPWPLPEMFQPFYGYWLQGGRKRFMLPQPDDAVQRCMALLDKPAAARQPQQQPQQQQQQL